MTTAEATTAVLDPETVAYLQRVQVVRVKFDQLGRGARMRASHDLRLGSSTVSSTVNGTVRNVRALEKLEDWLAKHP